MSRRLRLSGSLIVAAVLAIIAAITLRPSTVGEGLPFFCIACGSLGGVDLVLNMFLFIPLGVGLRVLLGNTSRAVFIAFLATLAIEALQWRVVSGRDAAFGDIIANTVGAWLGALVPAAIPSLWKARGAQAMRYAVWSSVLAAMLAVAVAYLLLPGHLRASYRVQWMALRANQDPFAGTLHAASLNSVTLRPVGVVTPDLLRDTIDLRAVVIGGNATSQRAEILRIATIGGEALLLGQRGDALVFRVATNANRFRFRSPLVGLHGQFPLNPPGELRLAATTIEGRSAPAFLNLTANRGAATNSVTLRRTVGLGWTLILPWETAIGPSWWPVRILWLAAMMLPVSFFAARALLNGHDAIRPRFAWWPVVIVIVALLVPPVVMGLSSLDAAEWSGVALGVAAGIGVARVAGIGSDLARSPASHRDAVR